MCASCYDTEHQPTHERQCGRPCCYRWPLRQAAAKRQGPPFHSTIQCPPTSPPPPNKARNPHLRLPMVSARPLTAVPPRAAQWRTPVTPSPNRPAGPAGAGPWKCEQEWRATKTGKGRRAGARPRRRVCSRTTQCVCSSPCDLRGLFYRHATVTAILQALTHSSAPPTRPTATYPPTHPPRSSCTPTSSTATSHTAGAAAVLASAPPPALPPLPPDTDAAGPCAPAAPPVPAAGAPAAGLR